MDTLSSVVSPSCSHGYVLSDIARLDAATENSADKLHSAPQKSKAQKMDLGTFLTDTCMSEGDAARTDMKQFADRGASSGFMGRRDGRYAYALCAIRPFWLLGRRSRLQFWRRLWGSQRWLSRCVMSHHSSNSMETDDGHQIAAGTLSENNYRYQPNPRILCT